MSVYSPARYIEVMSGWLQQRLEAAHLQWLNGRIEAHRSANSDRDLFITLGMVPRKLGKLDLAPSADELAQAEQARPGWDPSNWSIETTARLLVLCNLALHDEQAFHDKFNELCRTADLAESITLYCGIPFFPVSEVLDYQIGQGLRTHIRAVFEAIAHRNPYPRESFDQNRWNHMVLKALFVDSTLAPIQGLDERGNPELASILCDYAHERWAAGRPVTYELWRCVGPFAHDDMITDLQCVAESQVPLEHRAAVLALSQCPDPAAQSILHNILEQHPATRQAVNDGTLSWQSLWLESEESPP